ncbi:MAG: SAM-dependent chlorinase/fluorinase [Alphaproteobacteria bacterium]|nr:SAM-dependent chlorinase/fluorinase [Alphaproteobacteria bacterium]
MEKSFKPCGVITVTTDTANKGSFVATIKGMILRRFLEAKIVDLTHDSVVQWPAEAGFWLSRAYRYFPEGTVHLCVVDPGARIEPHALVAVCDGHAFLGPDNGVLAPLLASRAAVYAIDLKRLGRIGLEFTAGTFHGRDLYAPIAAALASGVCRPESLGEPTTDITPSWVDDPEVSAEEIRGVVLTVDNFGNLITNIDGTLLGKLAHPVVLAGGHKIPFRTTYGDVKPGDYLALVNSFGVLEVAQSEMSANQGLGIGRGSPVVVQDMKTPA